MRRAFLPFIIVLIALGCDTPSSWQPDEKDYFLKFYGIEGNQTGVDFVVNPDGTYVLVGNSQKPLDPLNQQIYVVKIDERGKVIWEVFFGGLGDEEAKDIELMADGILVVLANSWKPTGSDRDVMLMRLDQSGSKLDSIRQGLTTILGSTVAPPTDEDAKSLTIISDGFVVAGLTKSVPGDLVNKSDFMHLRFRNDLTWFSDAQGWTSRNGFAGEDAAIKIFQKPNGAFLVMGYTNTSSGFSLADFNFFVSDLSKVGLIGAPLIFGSPSSDEKMSYASQVPDGAVGGPGYYLSGIAQNQTSTDIYVTRTIAEINPAASDINANLTFQKINTKLGLNLGPPNNQSCYHYADIANCFVTSDFLNGTTSDIRLLQIDGAGTVNQSLDKKFGGIGQDESGTVTKLSDGHLVTIGTMTLGGVDGQKKMVFLKLNSEGRLAP